MVRHKVFVSFHEDDIKYKEKFVKSMEDFIIDKSVDTGDVDDTGLTDERVRQIIRDDYIRDASVTVVLIGSCTWQRKHVDWEIGGSLRDTKRNSRCGMLGIVLPGHRNYWRKGEVDPHLLPPRLADNIEGDDPYARIYDWPFLWTYGTSDEVSEWIDKAFQRKDKEPPPDNARDSFKRNHTGRECWDGWTD